MTKIGVGGKYRPDSVLVLVLSMLAILSIMQGLSDYASSPLTGYATITSNATITNALPTLSSASLNGATDITLSANSTVTVNGTVTVTDNNGCSDIDGVNMTLHNNNLTLEGSDDNRTRYINASCKSHSDCSGGDDLAATYSCSFTLRHFATPSDASSNHSANKWNVTIFAWDSDGTGTGTTAQQEVNTLSSISVVSTAIAFGNIALGSNTGSTNTNVTVANTGNIQLDVDVDAYGGTDGDDNSMNCTTGNVTVTLMKYNNISFTYEATGSNFTSGYNMTDTAAELNLDALQGSDSDNAPYEYIVFGMGLPSTGVGGTCTGYVTIAANSDANGLNS